MASLRGLFLIAILKMAYGAPDPMVLTKKRLFGVDYVIADYEVASDLIIQSAAERKSFGMSALAVHGLMECVKHPDLAALVNRLDMITPDGQPVRWALNSLHNANMKDRVAGPDLTLHVLRKADKRRLSVYLYGSEEMVLLKFKSFIQSHFPGVTVCGMHPDRFREATDEEDRDDIDKINLSGAHIVLVGRGCPRQEKWVARHLGKVTAAMMAVGAAFDFHAGTVRRAPRWMQNAGLEWAHRLSQDPRRLWKRYLETNSRFAFLFLKQKFFDHY